MEISTKPEFPIWSSNSRIVRFSCVGHNEFATSADPGIDHDVLAAKSRETGWSQWVDATLARTLFMGVSTAKFVRKRGFKQSTALFRFD